MKNSNVHVICSVEGASVGCMIKTTAQIFNTVNSLELFPDDFQRLVHFVAKNSCQWYIALFVPTGNAPMIACTVTYVLLFTFSNGNVYERGWMWWLSLVGIGNRIGWENLSINVTCVFGSFRPIFGSPQVIFGILRRSLGHFRYLFNLRRSSTNFRESSE